MSYETIDARFDGSICFLQLNRPRANNTINATLVAECSEVLARCEEAATIVVLSGLPEVFCMGADFQAIRDSTGGAAEPENGAEPLYDLWLKLATGPFVSIAHVRGKANAGGMGFVAASDIVLADHTAQFSLSELLFGLFPACVLPFLIRRIGFQKAHYLTLMTQPIAAQQAHAWGLVDACEEQGEALVRRHVSRLRRLSKPAVARYKKYMSGFHDDLVRHKSLALRGNREIFSDPQNLQGIRRYVDKGLFPWEADSAASDRG